MSISGEAIRNRLEYLSCDDYDELILMYLSDLLGYDYKFLIDNIKVKLKPADNQKLILFSGNESELYNLMVDLSQLGHEPFSRYPELTYTYDLLYKRPEEKSELDDYTALNNMMTGV